MELKVDLPSLSGQNIDPDTFQRVWNRVMPNQPAPRESTSSSDTVPPAQDTQPGQDAAPDLPAVPTCPAEETRPPVPTCPAEETPPPVPDCPAQPECPSCPETPSCPECPSCPEAPARPECPSCPECPACPECPSCPETPSAPSEPEAPALCLGDASQGDSARLEALMTLAQEGAAAARMLARRSSGSCSRTLAALAQDHRMAFRRLSAAYFLITGTRYTPKCTTPALPASLALSLRQQFVWEQQWEVENKQAARATADPCLKELYQELAQEGAFHAGAIRSLLEQM